MIDFEPDKIITRDGYIHDINPTSHLSRLTETAFDQDVVSDGDPLVAHLAVPTLVDQLLDCAQIRVTPGDVGLDDAEHVQGCLVQLHEDAVVDLTQTEKLEGLANLRVQAVDTDNGK